MDAKTGSIDEGGCPMSGCGVRALLGRTNKDWWPEMLATEILNPNGSSNPMGAAAMTLSGGEYAIHGTNAPASIGGFVSYGCIRMYNQDISDLFSRVEVGTLVIVKR